MRGTPHYCVKKSPASLLELFCIIYYIATIIKLALCAYFLALTLRLRHCSAVNTRLPSEASAKDGLKGFLERSKKTFNKFRMSAVKELD
jgi:hypothetical protein